MNQLPSDQLREIPKWTRAYARNRTLPALVTMVGWFVLFFAGSRFFTRAGIAYRAGDMPLFSVWLTAGLICLGTIMSIAIPAVARKLRRFLSHALYGGEGELEVSTAADHRAWSYLVAAIFILGVLAQVFLSSRIPEQYQQPISALYVLPFLIFIAPGAGLAGILYPLLYGLHALLVLVGVPILFHGDWATLNVVVPIGVYGLLSLLIGHIYNRIALRRLRRLARPS
jgi:hypothetical protein